MRVRLPRLFYGWWIVASGGSLGSLNAGFYFYGIGAFFTPMLDEFGWSRAALSGASSLARLQEGLAAPLAGAAVDRFGPRRVILAGIIVFGAGYLWLSQAPNHLILVYAIFILISAGNSFATLMPTMTAVNNWFVRRRGLAMGILMTGYGLGGAFGLPLLGWLITQYGWRNSMVLVGVAFWVVGIPAALVMRRRPEDEGLLPDGDTPRHASSSSSQINPARTPSHTSEADFSPRQALATRAFWLLSIAFSIRQMVSSGLALHQVPLLVSRNLSLADATAILGGMVLVSITGRLFWGWLGDRWDRRWVLAACHLLLGVGALAMTSIPMATGDNQSELYSRIAVAMLVYGVGYGGTIPVSVAMIADYFGRQSYGTIQGMSSLITMVGNMAGPVLAGYIFDVTLSYEVALIFFGVITIIGLPLFGLVHRPLGSQKAPAAGL